MTDSSLSTFRSTDQDLSPDAESVARCATTTAAPDRDGLSWAAPDTEWGLRTQRPLSSVRTSGGRASKQQVRWVVSGDLAEYVERYGDGDLVSIPDTYDGFRNVKTYVAFVDGRYETDGVDATYGYGFDGSQLEIALRVLTGGGRYTASKYTVIPCGCQPWVLTGPEGTLLCSCVPVERPADGRRTTELRVAGTHLEIEEENRDVLAGAAQFASLLVDSLGVDIDRLEYDTVRGETRHTFVDEDDQKHQIAASDLALLAGVTSDPSAIQGTLARGIQPPHGGDTVTAEWDGPTHPVGYLDDGDVIAGYEFCWETPGESLENVATVRTYRLTRSHDSWTVEFDTDRIVSVVP